MPRIRSSFLFLAVVSLAFVPSISLAAPPAAKPDPAGVEKPSNLPSDRLETQYGTVTIQADPKEESTSWLAVKGEKLVQLEGDKLQIVAHLHQRGRDILLVEIGSGGIACPMMYRFLELGPKKKPVVSEEFGSCGEQEKAAFDDGKVVVQIPDYVPHPDLLTEAEVERSERTTLYYTWENGAVQEKAVVRK